MHSYYSKELTLSVPAMPSSLLRLLFLPLTGKTLTFQPIKVEEISEITKRRYNKYCYTYIVIFFSYITVTLLPGTYMRRNIL